MSEVNCKQGVVVYTYNPNTKEAEAGGFPHVAGQHDLGNGFQIRLDYVT